MVRLNEMNEDLHRTYKNKTTCVMYKKCNNLQFRCVEKQCLDAIQLHPDISKNAYITTNTEWRKSYKDVKCQ